MVSIKKQINFWKVFSIFFIGLSVCTLVWFYLFFTHNNPKGITLSIKNSNYVISKVIVNLTSYIAPNNDQEALRYGKYQKSMSGNYKADIGIMINSFYQCPINAISVEEYEGSILGSYGINKSITYFLPKIDTSKCTKDTKNNTYKFLLKWSRRSDTDWTILIPGYINGSEFAMFTENINKDTQPNQEKANEISQEYSSNLITTTGKSLTNNPKIISQPNISLNPAEKKLKIALDLEFGNPCSSDVEMGLETETWSSSDNSLYIWANPKQTYNNSSKEKFCTLESNPVKKKINIFVPINVSPSKITVLIPNYPAGQNLPIYIENIRL